ncbi:unnamed protein product [Clonostachys chloroleuca]|uniref:F-box domain-containing protein n=1 Tax=Clonostachys chloroleuca TaxID=1926264 RepID=A0AA35Q083_9HYPO|nr:unnamed protein product [Clonostachys chloroleuca]
MMGSLPAEILHCIFEHLETPLSLQHWEPLQDWKPVHHPQPRALIALSQVSHLFRSVTRPLIYRTVVLRSPYGQDDIIYMDKLMHILCADPEIGHNIRGLQVYPWMPGYDVDYFARKLRASPENLDDRQKRWLNKWAEAENDNATLVALLVAPRLRSLEYMGDESIKGIAAYLSGRKDVEDDYFATALDGDADNHSDNASDETGSETASEDGDEDTEPDDVPAGQQKSQLVGPLSENPLSLLREVRVGRRGGYGPGLKRARNIEGVLLNPGLEILRLSAYRWTKGDVRAMKWNNVMNNITTLQLMNCLIDERGLANALRRCRLRHLHIVMAPDYGIGADEYGTVRSFSGIGVALRKYGQSLESLDFESTRFRHGYYYVMIGHIGPLSELGRLKSLKMGVQDLGEFDEGDEEELKMELRTSLPPTLESICVRRSGNNGRRVPLTLLTDEVFSELRTIEVEDYKVIENEYDTKALEVPGWFKSFRTGVNYTYGRELSRHDRRTITIFSRDGEVD